MIFLLEKTPVELLLNGTYEQVFEVLDEIRSTSGGVASFKKKKSGGVANSTLRIDKIFKRRNDSTIEYEQKNGWEEKKTWLYPKTLHKDGVSGWMNKNVGDDEKVAWVCLFVFVF